MLRWINLIAYNYEYQEEINWKADHEVLLAKVKRADGDYDYFQGNNGGFRIYTMGKNIVDINFWKAAGIKDLDFMAWQVNAPKEYKVSKLEKEAYQFAIDSNSSELDDIAKNYQ